MGGGRAGGGGGGGGERGGRKGKEIGLQGVYRRLEGVTGGLGRGKK